MNSRAFLFLQAKRRVYRCQFTKDLTLIGSDRDNDIVIRDPSVLGEHARISRAGGVYTLRPIADSEVRVGGELVETAYELENGDRIEIGDTFILFAREYAESPVTVHLMIRRTGEPPMGFWTSKSTIVIGREKGDIIIDDPLLSKVHTIIENFCIDGWFVLDARSERGTGLNGESIDARHQLRDGDTITLGGIEIEFRARPFDNPTGQDAARLAAERVDQLRAVGAFRGTNSRVGGELGATPRNPYQRYPSQLPDASPPDAPPRERDDSPRSHPGTSGNRASWSSRPQTAARDAGPGRRGRRSDARPRPITALPPAVGRRAPNNGRGALDSPTQIVQPRQRRGMDLRSGVETGIIDAAVANADAAERGRGKRRPRANSNLPSTGAAPVGRCPQLPPEPEHLPTLAPREGWGNRERGRRSFAERSEENTRLSLGNADKSGLWYLPGGPDGPGAPVPRPAGKPIIAARGDRVPTAPPPTREAPPAGHRPGRAMIRRQAPGGLKPMQARPEAPRPRVRTVPPPPRRLDAPPTGGDRPNSPPPVPRRGSPPPPPAAPRSAPGSRPDNRERWYAPNPDQKPIRQRRGDAAWYLPQQRTPDPRANEEEARPPKRPGGHKTQMIDGEDWR